MTICAPQRIVISRAQHWFISLTKHSMVFEFFFSKENFKGERKVKNEVIVAYFQQSK